MRFFSGKNKKDKGVSDNQHFPIMPPIHLNRACKNAGASAIISSKVYISHMEMEVSSVESSTNVPSTSFFLLSMRSTCRFVSLMAAAGLPRRRNDCPRRTDLARNASAVVFTCVRCGRGRSQPYVSTSGPSRAACRRPNIVA